MTHWRRFLVAGIGALSLLGLSTVGVASDEGDTLVQFDSMTPVTGSAVDTVNDRGIRGGGFPWAITEGSGEVDSQGNIEVEVTGLVIPVAPFNGRNPALKFQAVVSCLTAGGVVNVKTAAFPANSAGDSTIDTSVALPSPCNDPVVFVGTTLFSGTFVWFARSKAEENH